MHSSVVLFCFDLLIGSKAGVLRFQNIFLGWNLVFEYQRVVLGRADVQLTGVSDVLLLIVNFSVAFVLWSSLLLLRPECVHLLRWNVARAHGLKVHALNVGVEAAGLHLVGCVIRNDILWIECDLFDYLLLLLTGFTHFKLMMSLF